MSGFDIELPATLRITPEDLAADPEWVAEWRREFPDGEVIVSDDTRCPHCVAAGITIGEDGIITDLETGQESGYAHMRPYAPVPGTGGHRDRRKARRKAERKARKRSR